MFTVLDHQIFNGSKPTPLFGFGAITTNSLFGIADAHTCLVNSISRSRVNA